MSSAASEDVAGTGIIGAKSISSLVACATVIVAITVTVAVVPTVIVVNVGVIVVGLPAFCVNVQGRVPADQGQRTRVDVDKFFVEGALANGISEAGFLSRGELFLADEEVVLDAQFGGGEMQIHLPGEDGAGRVFLPSSDDFCDAG